MRSVTIWVSAHGQLLVAIVSISLWVLANYWYLRFDIRRMLNERKARSWSVDLETRTGKGGRPNLH